MKIIKTAKSEEKELLEELSDLEHVQWTYWTEHLLKNNDETHRKQWNRQIEIDYKDLTEKEKDGDREWAEKVLKIVKKYKDKI
jgi:hypothetical protein